MGNSNPYGFGYRSTAEDVTVGIDLTGKVAVVTGANTGIGKETARVLALRGARVILGCRDQTKGNAVVAEIVQNTGVPAERVECLSLDLSSFESVKAFANEFKAKDIPLNLLILNAGVMMHPWALTADGFETTFGVNHLGHFLLTSLLIDKVKASAPARIVSVASEAHRYGSRDVTKVVREEKDYSAMRAYGNSKLANILFAMELNRRLQQEGADVAVNSIHPGVIHSDLTRSSTLAHIFYTVSAPFLKSIAQGTATTLFAATHPSITPANSGKYFADSNVATTTALGTDLGLAAELWTLSEQLTGTTLLSPVTAQVGQQAAPSL